MTKDEALALNYLFVNVQGYKALCTYVEGRIEDVKKQLLTAPMQEVPGLQQSAVELKRILSLREKAQQVLEAKD